MEVIINGNSSMGNYSTISELLKSQGVDPKLVVVELNGKILPAGDFDTTKLKEGDVVEIVQFVAGG